MTWHPVLDGAAAIDAMAAVHDIAHALLQPDPDVAVHAALPDLAGGKTGLALFFAELGEATGDEAATHHALTLLDDAITEAADAPLTPGLFSGTMGVGWALEVLSGRLFVADDNDENDLDDLAERLLEPDPWPWHFDVVAGLLGIGVYLLQRLPRERAQRNLRTLLQRLADIAEHTPQGLAWRAEPSKLPQTPPLLERFAQFPDGYFDTGLAHGAAGVLAFLAAAVEAGEPDAKELLVESTRWLRSHRRADTSAGTYPLLFVPGVPEAGGRSAWCYGDVSVAVGLFAAGRALGDESLLDEALVLTKAAAARMPRQAGVVDTGLCHGSAGLAHVCNRLAQATGDGDLLALSRRWFDHTLRHRRHGEAVAGFPAYTIPEFGADPRYMPLPGALEGAAGVGLALLAAVGTSEPRWDGFLLLGPLTPAGQP